MADITVKNLYENAKLILAQKAKKAGLSQNKYICTLLETHVLVERSKAYIQTMVSFSKCVWQ